MKSFVSFCFVACLIFLSSENTLGCSCFELSEKQTDKQIKTALHAELEKALAVFTGEVIEATSLKVKFKTAKVWKGAVGDEQIMSTGTKDLGNGVTTSSSCDFHFEKGKQYLVVGFGKDYEEMQAYYCTSTKLLKNSERIVKLLDEIVPHEKRNEESNGKTKFIQAAWLGFIKGTYQQLTTS